MHSLNHSTPTRVGIALSSVVVDVDLQNYSVERIKTVKYENYTVGKILHYCTS